MPIAALFFGSIGQLIYRGIVYLVGAQYATRVAGMLALAGLYIAAVTLFAVTIAPWMEAIFNTAYGSLLGLLFPPISGTVMAGLVTLWGAVHTYHYVASFTAAAIGK